MSFENFKPDNSFENTEEETPLNPEEAENLGEDMREFVKGLEEMIRETEKEIERAQGEERDSLMLKLEELRYEYEGLRGFAEDIELNNYDDIVERPYKED